MAHATGPPNLKSGTEPGEQARGAILLVEPDRATRKLYARAVARFWRVIEAQSAAEAQDQLGDDPPLAVVIEPFERTLEEGWALLRSVRHRRDGSHIPVVVCSVVDERRTAYALGATSYLLKPVSPQQLIDELQRVLGSTTSLDKE